MTLLYFELYQNRFGEVSKKHEKVNVFEVLGNAEVIVDCFQAYKL